MMGDHKNYKFSITVHSDDLAVINCLRALSQYSQKTGNNRIPWGGTKDSDWENDNHHVNFRFTCTEYREGFKSEVRRLLPTNSCEFTGESNNDPAHKVSK
jgi:hypothetical protein